MSLTDQEILRYSRHIILPEVGGRGQRRLKSASVLLAGLGAAGSAAALYLAAAGVGRIGLWDPGLVAPGDLESCIAHDRSRLGWPRARSAAEPLRAINPDALVEVIDRESDLIGRLPEYQILLGSLGDWEELLDHLPRGAAAVLCAVHGARGAVAAFQASEPCYRCLGANRARELGLFPEGAGGVAAAAGVIGVVAATEAIKLVLGIGQPLFGRVLTYDGWTARFREEGFRCRPDCTG
jgi:molybdopterin/thiamine biosynthesis adenylyltransferase